jgi:hypothetical protein
VTLLAVIASAMTGAILALICAFYWYRREVIALQRLALLLAGLWRDMDPASRPRLTFRHQLALSAASLADRVTDSVCPERGTNVTP